MSDTAQWWVVALLVVFMVGGMLWLLLARTRRTAPSGSAPVWHQETVDELGVLPAFASARSISTADVTLSRGLGGGVDVAIGSTALDDLSREVGVPAVGDELSDRSWASAPSGVVPSEAVTIAEVHHGADGHEHGDAEWVLLTNGGAEAVDLTGWRLTDEGEKHTYAFSAVVLAPGGSVRVHMARGEDGAADLFVGRNQRWWNNDGDCASLFDASGALVHKHCYGDAATA